MWQDGLPKVWSTSFPHLLTLSKKSLNKKVMITCNRPTTIGQKLTNYKHLALITKNANRRFFRTLQALCTLWLPWQIQQVHSPNCFTNPGKIKLSRWTESTVYVGQTVNKFSTRWSWHRGTWNKPDKDDSDQMASSQHCSVFHGILNKPPIQNSYTITFWLSGYLWR